MAVAELVEEMVRHHLEKVDRELDELREQVQKEKQERDFLYQDNQKLKKQLTDLAREVDANEQYGRKNTLIISGSDLPAPTLNDAGQEDPAVTRQVVKQVIQEKLGVQLKGQITACHRLRNKKRAVVRFQDSDDRQKVYEARFPKPNQEHKIIVQENLTAKRAQQIGKLAQLKRDGQISAYHTRNGNIYARASAEQKFAPIQPEMSVDEILDITFSAPLNPYFQRNQETSVKRLFNRSQTLDSIPSGHVASRRAGLEEYVVGPTRPSRH